MQTSEKNNDNGVVHLCTVLCSSFQCCDTAHCWLATGRLPYIWSV